MSSTPNLEADASKKRIDVLINRRLFELMLSLDELRGRLDMLAPHCGGEPDLNGAANKLHLAATDLGRVYNARVAAAGG